MTFLALCGLCFLSIHSVFVPLISAETVTFGIDQSYNCKPQAAVNVRKNDTLKISFLYKSPIKEANCSTSDSPFLVTKDFEASNFNDIKGITATIKKPSEKHAGQWNCMFIVESQSTHNFPDKILLVNGSEYLSVNCSVFVNVTDLVSSSTPLEGDDKTTFYIIIGGVVAGVVLIIICIQTAIIMHYKSKAVQRSNLTHLEQRPPARRDDNCPPELRSEESTSTEGIQLVGKSTTTVKEGPPPNIKDRPPMPPPIHVDSDEDSIYNDGNTLGRMFAPEPPSIRSLPRRKKDNKIKPKPAPKPVKQARHEIEEDYDYADNTTGSINRRLILDTSSPKPDKNLRNEKPHNLNPRAVPPKPSPAPAPMMNELDNILRKRNTNQTSEPPAHFEGGKTGYIEGGIPPTGLRKPSAPIKETQPPQNPRYPPGMRGPQEREMRLPPNARPPPGRPAQDPRLAQNTWSQDRPQIPRYPQEDFHSPENPRRPQDFRQNLRSPEQRFDQRSQMRPEPQGLRSPPFVSRPPDVARVPHQAMAPVEMMRSPPLPRKPNAFADGACPPLPGIRKPLPPPPDTESVYEPVAEGESSDDDEWKIEPLEPYNIYNI